MVERRIEQGLRKLHEVAYDRDLLESVRFDLSLRPNEEALAKFRQYEAKVRTTFETIEDLKREQRRDWERIGDPLEPSTQIGCFYARHRARWDKFLELRAMTDVWTRKREEVLGKILLGRMRAACSY